MPTLEMKNILDTKISTVFQNSRIILLNKSTPLIKAPVLIFSIKNAMATDNLEALEIKKVVKIKVDIINNLLNVPDSPI